MSSTGALLPTPVHDPIDHQLLSIAADDDVLIAGDAEELEHLQTQNTKMPIR